MSHKPSKAYYVEGVHRFWIDEGYVVCRIECSDYYARQAQNFCGGCKEMDFLLYHPERRDLWLVEVRDFSIQASGAETLHLAFLLEMGMGGVWTDGGLLANVKNLLVGSMRFLDAELVCAPITYPRRIGPWRVTSAHGEVSKRVEIRRARKLAEIQEQRRRERLTAQEEGAWQEKSREDAGSHAAPAEERMPQWKRRLRQRMNGESANHEGRRRKRKRE